MKVVYTILLNILGLYALHGQSNAINYEDFEMNNTSILTIDKTSLINLIGQPNSTQNINFEYLDLPYAEVLYYHLNSEFVFPSKPNEDGTQIKGFGVLSSSFIFKYAGVTFKVGDPLSVLNIIFPSSYQNRDNERKIMTVRLGYNENGTLRIMDGHVTITFDGAGIITSITHAYAG